MEPDYYGDHDRIENLIVEFGSVSQKFVDALKRFQLEHEHLAAHIDTQAMHILDMEATAEKQKSVIQSLEAENNGLKDRLEQLELESDANRNFVSRTIDDWRQRIDNIQNEVDDMLLKGASRRV